VRAPSGPFFSFSELDSCGHRKSTQWQRSIHSYALLQRLSLRTSVRPESTDPKASHAVVITGYDSSINGGQCWMNNPWGDKDRPIPAAAIVTAINKWQPTQFSSKLLATVTPNRAPISLS
jgi:hypothetical protein